MEVPASTPMLRRSRHSPAELADDRRAVSSRFATSSKSCRGCHAFTVPVRRLRGGGRAPGGAGALGRHRLCAGFPNQTLTHDDAEIWSYKRQSTPSGGLTVSTPLSVVPGFSQSANIGAPIGTCSMQVRFVQGKVVEVAYAGDTDVAGIRHAYCAPLISNCLSYRPVQGH